MYKELIRDVFFDLDHTLWDFDRNSALTFDFIFKRQKIDVALSVFLAIYVPNNLKFWKLYREEQITKEELRYQRLKTTFDDIGYSISDTRINRIAEDYISFLSSFNHLFPNTIEILKYLKPKYNLHIITNGFAAVQEKKLVNSGIRSFFDQIINSEMAGVKKPKPGIFTLALEKAQAIPEASLMIGDSLEADILGAKALGFYALHFDTHKEPPHAHAPIISSLDEIKSFL